MSTSCGDHCSETDSPRYRNIVWICLIANLVMFVVQMVASYLAGSVSLLANSLDFLSDGLNYAITLFVLDKALTVKAKASLFKGVTLGLVGLWTAFEVVNHAFEQEVPEVSIMGGISLIALLVNVGCAFLLYRYRGGDSNSRSVWICSRNDAIGNIAVMIAAAGVFASSTIWPDLIVACILAWLALSGAWLIVRQARKELGESSSNFAQ